MIKLKIGWGLRVMLWIIKTFQKPIHLSDIEQLKKRSNSKFTAYFYDLIKVNISRVSDLYIPSDDYNIPARLYHPNSERKLPVILYFHGGGFVLGGIESYDHFCRRLSKVTQCAILSVDYRLAPEYKFPAAHDDALASLVWIYSCSDEYNLDTSRLFVAGDSSGGNLAAYLAFEARDRNLPLRGQILIYPVLDAGYRDRKYFDQFLLGKEGSNWFIKSLINSPEDLQSPRLSVLRNDDIKGLASVMIIKAGYDHLNSEIGVFCSKLEGSDVEVLVSESTMTFHGFITMNNWTAKIKEQIGNISTFISENR